MGGAIALEFTLRDPARLAGLILAGTGARLRVAPEILNGILEDYAGTTMLLAQWSHGEHVETKKLRLYIRRLHEASPGIIHSDFAARDAFDRRGDIARIATYTHPLRRRRPDDAGQVQPTPARANRRLAVRPRAPCGAHGDAGVASGGGPGRGRILVESRPLLIVKVIKSGIDNTNVWC